MIPSGVFGRFFGLFLVAFCLFYRVFEGFDEGDDILRVFGESNGFSTRYRVGAVICKACDAEFGVFFIRADGEKSPLSVVGNIAGVRAIPYVVRVVIQRLFLLGKDEWR